MCVSESTVKDMVKENDFTAGDNNFSVEEESKQKSWMFWKTRRYVVGIMVFLGFYNVYALRVNLSIAIVAMTETKVILSEDGNITYIQEFNWDSKQQGFILSSFFYGYITTQLLGGWLATKYGGARIFGLGIAVTAALTVVTPFAAKQSFYLLLAVRIVEGIFEGVTYPCNIAIWSRWSPPLERSRWVSFAMSGCFVGTVISMPVCAYLSNSFGWESVFYIYGGIGLLWYAFWFFIVAETPDKDSRISENEANFIKKALEDENSVDAGNPPWSQILKSTAVWAIFAAHFSENWGYYTLITQLPKFLKDVLHFELGKTGLLAAIPYLVMTINLQIGGVIADWVQVKGWLTRVQVRKLYTCGAFISQTIFMLLITYLLTPLASMVCLTIAVGLGAFAYGGFLVNYLDVAPNHASILIGIGNTFSTLPGILSPIITGYVVTTGSEKEWNIVFYITSGIYLTGSIIYGSLAQGKIQKWAIKSECSSNLKEVQTGRENPAFSN